MLGNYPKVPTVQEFTALRIGLVQLTLQAMPSDTTASSETAAPLPSLLPGRLLGPLTLQAVNAKVQSVLLADGTHVGNLKQVGAVWKFKAVGYDPAGGVEPGGGPLTQQHNMVFAQPDATLVSAHLLQSLANRKANP